MTTDFSQFYEEDDVEASIAGRNDVKGRPFWTPKEGASRVIIMPAPKGKAPNEEGKITFYTWVPTHSYLPGAQQPVICPRLFAGQPCASCALANEYRQSNNEKLRIKFSASWKALVNVLVLDAKGKPTPDTRPLWWTMNKTLMESLLSKIEEKVANGEDMRITSPRYGRHVFVRRTGTGPTTTKYEIQLAEQATPWTREMAEAYLPKMNTLDAVEVYELPSGDRMTALLTAPKSAGGWDAEPDEEDIDAIFGPPAGTVDGVFTEVPMLNAGVEESPFADPPADEVEEDDGLPWAEDDDVPAVAAAAPAASKVSAARDRLQASIQSKKAS